MDARIIVANMHMLTIAKYQDYTHFGHNRNIFIKLYSTKTNFIRYVDMFAVFFEGELLLKCLDCTYFCAGNGRKLLTLILS